MQAIILAGGKGLRLKPHTKTVPKPLLELGQYPILEIIIRQLKRDGFRDIVLAVYYMKEKIQSYFGNGDKWDLKIRYSEENTALGTAAPLRLIENLEDDFIVTNGDILTDLRFNDILQFHHEQHAISTIASCTKPFSVDLGILKKTKDHALLSYDEKPSFSCDVSMGVYGMNKTVLAYLPSQDPFDIPTLMNVLLQKKKKVLCFPFKGYWFDVGSIHDYKNAIETFKKNKSAFLMDRDT